MNLFSATSIELFAAVAVASFMGSLHCVGMCGPFALMATGASTTKRQTATRITAYHLGRLTTYLIGGLLMGLAGVLISSSGQWLGIQSAAARVAGVLMILLGVWKLVDFSYGGVFRLHHLHGFSQKVSGWLASLRPTLGKMPPHVRAYSAGGLTTLLPCGWLYVFLLVAAGTGTIASSMVLMLAFWIGSLPALTSLALGAHQLAPKFKKALPAIAGVILLLTGSYTAIGRATADFTNLTKQSQSLMAKASDGLIDNSTTTINYQGSQTTLEHLDALKKQPLPCCQTRLTSQEEKK